MGRFTSVNGYFTNKVARINIDGSVDTTFNIGSGIVGENGPFRPYMATNVIVQQDDKIIICGSFLTFNGVNKNSIVRLNSDGSIDSSFITGNGFQFNDLFNNALVPADVSYVRLRSNGQIILTGNFSRFNNIAVNSTKGITVLNANGSLDTSFDASIALSQGGCYRTELQNDGKIIIAAINSTFFPGAFIAQKDYYLKRLNINGSIDPTFTINNTILNQEYIGGVPSNNSLGFVIYDIKYLTNGKIAVAGKGYSSTNPFSTNNSSISILNSNGSVDTTFQGGGINTYGEIYTLDIQSDNKIIIGGTFNSYAGVNVKNIARLNPNGTFDNTFNTGAGFDGGGSSVSFLKKLPNNKILVIGNFNNYNGTIRNSIARLNGSLSTCLNLTGDTFVCENQTKTYTVTDPCTNPSPIIYTNINGSAINGWSVEGNLAILSSTAYSVTVQSTGNGAGKVIATFQNGQKIYKEVWVGKPSFYLSVYGPDNAHTFVSLISADNLLPIDKQGITNVVIRRTSNSGVVSTIISGGVFFSRRFDPSTTRLLTVTVTNACGSTTATWYRSDEMRTAPSTEIKVYTVFPNPTTDIINIELHNKIQKPIASSNISATVYNMMGEVKANIKVIDHRASLQTSNFSKGLYILQISIDGNIENHYITIE